MIFAQEIKLNENIGTEKERSSVHPINMIGMSTELFEQKYLKREKSVGSREETTAKAESPNLRTAVTHTDHTLSNNSIPTNIQNVNGNVLGMDSGGVPGSARRSATSLKSEGNVIQYTPEEAYRDTIRYLANEKGAYEAYPKTFHEYNDVYNERHKNDKGEVTSPVASESDLGYNRDSIGEGSVVSGREGAEARVDGSGDRTGTENREVGKDVLSGIEEKEFGRGSTVGENIHRSARGYGLTRLSDERISAADIVDPQPESVGAHVKENAKEYGFPCHVLNDAAFARIKKKADSYARKGQMYIRDGADDFKKAGYVPHEASHIMKQLNYKPYIDFIVSLPEKVNMSSQHTREVLSQVAEHMGHDNIDLTSKQASDFWDEFNATVYGTIQIAKEHGVEYREYFGGVFHDLDGYVAEMDEIHERFKKENVAAQLNNNEEAVDANRASTASSAYSDGDGAQRAARPTSEVGDGSYFEDTELDTYFDENEKRAQVVQDKRIEDAEKALMSKPKTEKKSMGDKAKESVSFAKRKMVNSGDAIRKIEKKAKSEHLYSSYNRARSSMNIVTDMLQNKQTNIRGQKVGESLEGIISPIKAKGEEYWRDFQLYLLHKHNVARMSIHDAKAEQRARTELEIFNKENPGIATQSEKELERLSKWDDDRGLKVRKYLELRKNLRAAEEKNKPIFFDSDNVPLNADESRKKAKELLRKNSDFAENEANIRKYLDNLMQYRIDSGLITEEAAEYFRKKYPNYVPTYRNTESVQKQMQGKTNIGKTEGKAKGGNDPILPLDVALSEMTKKVIRSGQKNIFANKLLSAYDNNSKLLKEYITDIQEGDFDIDSEMDNFGEEKAFDNTVSFYSDGKRIELTVTPELFEAFDAISKVPKEQPAVAKAVRKVNDAYKKLITTWDPTFFIRNGFKDLQDAMINSRSLRSFAKNYPKAFGQIVSNGEMWQMYQAAGGLYSSRFEELQGKGVKARRGKESEAGKIYPNMPEKERTKLLNKTDIEIIQYNDKHNRLSKETVTELEKTYKSQAQKVLKPLAEKFGIFKEYSNSQIELDFNYSKGSLSESVHTQNERNPNFVDFAKMLSVFDEVVANAQPIEAHYDKYDGTIRENKNINQIFVLLSAFKDGNDIVPVEFNIKEFKKGVKNQLYVSVALKRIEADLVGNLSNEKHSVGIPKSTSKYSLTEIIKNINSSEGDFFRYVPDEMLSKEQMASKKKSLEKDSEKLSKLRKKEESAFFDNSDFNTESNVNAPRKKISTAGAVLLARMLELQ